MMPLLTENNALIPQSNALWKSYLENQTSPDMAHSSRRFSQDFWINYETLVQKAKAVKVPQKKTAVQKHKRLTNTQSMAQLFYRHWHKPFNLQEHLSLNPPVKTSNNPPDDASQTRFFVVMLVMFLSGMFALLFDKEVLGFVMITLSIIVSLTKAYSMDTIDTMNLLPAYEFSVDNKSVYTDKVFFAPNFLTYQFYDPQQDGAVKIHIPYGFITSIWEDDRGIKVVGRNRAMWKDTQSQAAHEVILPNEKLLRSFLSDVAMFNFTQKS